MHKKEKKDEDKSKEKIKKDHFNKITQTLLMLEINGRHLMVAETILETSKRENATNHYFPYLDTTDHCQTLIEFVDPSLIYELYFIQTRLNELELLIERGKKFHTDTIKEIIFNKSANNDYLIFENSNNKLMVDLILQIHVLLKYFFSHMKEYVKKEYPNEKLPPIIEDFREEMHRNKEQIYKELGTKSNFSSH